MVLSFLAN